MWDGSKSLTYIAAPASATRIHFSLPARAELSCRLEVLECVVCQSDVACGLSVLFVVFDSGTGLELLLAIRWSVVHISGKGPERYYVLSTKTSKKAPVTGCSSPITYWVEDG